MGITTDIPNLLKIRNDLSLQGSENIRFFTYVTVVFLPLGFATGIFSMSGAPDGKVLGSMAICAVVALLLTVLALLNAKQLAKIVDDLFSVYHKYSQAKMEQSLIVYDKKKRRNTSQDVEDADVEDADKKHDRVKLKANPHHRHREMPPRIETWTLLFWIHYFSIELPARRVLLASNSLKSGKPTFLTLIHVPLGIIFLLLFIISCLFQLVMYNLADLITAIWGKSLHPKQIRFSLTQYRIYCVSTHSTRTDAGLG